MKSIVMPLAIAALALGVLGCKEEEAVEAASNVEDILNERLVPLARQANDLQSRVLELEHANGRLRLEIDTLKKAAEEAGAGAVTGEAGEQVQEQVAAYLNEQGGVQQAMTQVFAENFQKEMTVYEEKKEAEEQARREERRQEYEARREEEREQRFAKLSEDLGLTEHQTGQLKTAEDTFRNTIRETMQDMREREGGFNREEAHETFAAMRDMHTQVASQILNEEQLKSYTEQQERRFFGGMMGGGRGGPGGGRGGR